MDDVLDEKNSGAVLSRPVHEYVVVCGQRVKIKHCYSHANETFQTEWTNLLDLRKLSVINDSSWFLCGLTVSRTLSSSEILKVTPL